MARSGAPRVRASACPASRLARSTAAAGRDIPAPQPAAALPAIISSSCSAAHEGGCRPAMSRCAGRRSDAVRWARARDPARPPCAARRSMAISPARWCEAAMPCAGGAMAVIVSAADREVRRSHHRADGSRISRSVSRTSDPVQSTSQNPYGSARSRATRGPAARVALRAARASLGPAFPSGLQPSVRPSARASPWPGFSRSGRSRRRT